MVEEGATLWSSVHLCHQIGRKENGVANALSLGPRVLVAAPLIFALGCSRSSNLSCAMSEAAVGNTARNLVASDNARDLTGVLAGYTDDVIWLPPNAEVVRGKEAIRPRYERLFSDFNVNLASEVVEAAAEGTRGFTRGFTKGTLAPRGGGAPVVVNDKFIALVRCEAGVWRVSHLMWSPRSPSP